MKRFALCWVFLLGVQTAALTVQAGTERELTYRYNQIWSALIRFIRVDYRCPIIEKDQKAGYILFEYHHGEKRLQSSFELVRTVREEKEFIRAKLRIQEMQSYVEGLLIDKFERKLRDEYGEPPPPKQLDLTKPKSPDTSDKKNSNEQAATEPPSDEQDVETVEDDLEETLKE